MTCRRWSLGRPLAGACAALLLMVASATAAGAQNNNTASSSAQSQPSLDFMLGRPRAAVGFSGNWMLASAGSDLYDFVTEQLTIEKSSFNAPAFGANASASLSTRLDVVANFETSKSSSDSEYRKFVDNNLLPIQQTTSLRQNEISGSLKYSLLPKGRSVSRFAWIPRGVTPYVGAGAGVVYYDFQQSGDFVNFQNNHVFTDSFRSTGWAPSAHGFGGVDVQIYRHLYMSIEGRYVWASADLKDKFVGFDPIDLAGVRFGGGIHVVF